MVEFGRRFYPGANNYRLGRSDGSCVGDWSWRHFAGLAGFRAFIPLAVYMFMARMGWVWGFRADGMAFMISDAAVVILLVLVVIEIMMTRVRALVSIERVLRLPLAVAAGALVMSATMAGEFPGAVHFIGIPVGAALALAGNYVQQGLVMIGEGRDPGPRSISRFFFFQF